MTPAIDSKESLLNALRTRPVPAVSIKQPWADRILFAGKDIENRTWATKHQGWVLIHAGQIPDHNVFIRHKDDSPKPYNRLGGIVGAVQIVGMVRESPSRWFQGPVGWQLANPIALPALIPCRGKLSLFQVPPDVLAQVIEGFSV